MINAIGTNPGASGPGRSRGGNGGNNGGSIGGKGRPSLDPQVTTGSGSGGTRTGGRGEPISKPRGKPLEVIDSAPIGGNTGPVGRGSSRNNNPRAEVIAPVRGGGSGGGGGGGRSNSSFQSNGINDPSFVNSSSQWNGGNNGNNWGGHSNGWNNSGNCGNGWGHGWNNGGSCWSGCNPSGWYGNWVGYWPYTSGLALGYYGSGWTFGLSVGFGSGWYSGCGSWPYYYGSYGSCWYPSSWSLSYGSCWNDCGWYPYPYAYGCYRPRCIYYQPVIYGAYTAPAYDWLAEPAVTTTYYTPSDIASTDQVYEFANTSAQTAPAEGSDFAPPPYAGAPVILDTTSNEHRSGWQLLADGDAREARRSFDRSLNMQSTDGLARVGYALSAGQLGRYEEAVSGMRQVLRQDPQSLDEIPQNSGIDAQIGQLQDHFEAELKSNQANVDDLFMVAVLRHLNGQNGLAYYAADRAIELGDHDQSVVNLKALIRKAIDSADQSAPPPPAATAPTVNAPSITAPASAVAPATVPASPEPLF